jgi:hypothetical protein
MTFKLRFVLGCMCLMAQPAFASLECSDKSPRFTQQGDTYWEINPISRSASADKNQFTLRVKHFAGRVEGKLQRNECSGGQDKTLIKTTQSSAKGTLEQANNGVKLVLEVTDLKDKSVKSERLEFLGSTSTVDFSADSAGGFITLQKIRANATPGDKISLLRETEYSISFAKNKLIIHAEHFANGYFYAEDNWTITSR